MNKEVISTEQAPRAIGPYAQAIKVDDIIYVSGQIPLDPSTGEIVSGGIKEHTEQALKNLEAVLKAAGAKFENIVKVTVYLNHMGDFNDMNEVYSDFFNNFKAARACIEASALPKGVDVEIDAVAHL